MMTESVEAQKSTACYARGEMRYAEDGTIVLNELGLPAKPGQIILRASNGYPLKRMGENKPVDIDVKTGKGVRSEAT